MVYLGTQPGHRSVDEGRSLGAGKANSSLRDRTDRRQRPPLTSSHGTVYEALGTTSQNHRQAREGPRLPRWSRAGLQDIKSHTFPRHAQSAYFRRQRSPRQEVRPVRSCQFAPGGRGLGGPGYQVSASEARWGSRLIWEAQYTWDGSEHGLKVSHAFFYLILPIRQALLCPPTEKGMRVRDPKWDSWEVARLRTHIYLFSDLSPCLPIILGYTQHIKLDGTPESSGGHTKDFKILINFISILEI